MTDPFGHNKYQLLARQGLLIIPQQGPALAGRLEIIAKKQGVASLARNCYSLAALEQETRNCQDVIREADSRMSEIRKSSRWDVRQACCFA